MTVSTPEEHNSNLFVSPPVRLPHMVGLRQLKAQG